MIAEEEIQSESRLNVLTKSVYHKVSTVYHEVSTVYHKVSEYCLL